MSRFAAGLGLVAVLAAGGRGADEADRKKAEASERAGLAGTWVCVSSEVNGVKRGEKESRDQTFAFEGNRFVQGDDATGDEIVGTYKLDLSGKRKVIVTTVPAGGRAATIRYLYERDGDTLKVGAHLLPIGPLPTDFTAPEGSRRMTATFKRAARK
ncbi:hypothetical protein J0H58_17535 [bacterium]|nr:hypothetical protein [bacterium]